MERIEHREHVEYMAQVEHVDHVDHLAKSAIYISQKKNHVGVKIIENSDSSDESDHKLLDIAMDAGMFI